MTNSTSGIQREIKVKGQKLGTVTSFKYLGAAVSDDGSNPTRDSLKDCTRHCSSYKAGAIWGDNNTLLVSKVKLIIVRSRVISIFMYACESCTLTAELKK